MPLLSSGGHAMAPSSTAARPVLSSCTHVSGMDAAMDAQKEGRRASSTGAGRGWLAAAEWQALQCRHGVM